MNRSTLNEKMIPFPTYVPVSKNHDAAHTPAHTHIIHPIEIHTYFSFLNLDNLTVLDAMNLSHSQQTYT